MILVDIVIGLVGAFIVLIVMYVFYWSRYGVPYVPTPRFVAQAMADFAKLTPRARVWDLGAGNGRILIETKKKFPQILATGVELSPIVWLVGVVRIFLSRQQIRFLRGDALRQDVRDADAIFLYMGPRMMELLQEKFDHELKPGAVVVSHAFSFPGKEPVDTVVLPGFYGKHTLRRYIW